MALDVDQVAAVLRIRGTPEMIEAHLHQRAYRRVTGDVSAEVALTAVGTHHRRHRVPAHVGADALLQRVIAGRMFLKVRRNRIDVRGRGRQQNVDSGPPRLLDQSLEQVMGPLRAFLFNDGGQRIEPFLGLDGIGVVGGQCNRIGGHRVTSHSNAAPRCAAPGKADFRTLAARRGNSKLWISFPHHGMQPR